MSETTMREASTPAEPCDLPAIEARRLIGTRRLSPVALLESCIARIEQVNPAVNAIVTASFARARAEARAAERAVAAGEALGPLHGLPVAIKDNQDTEGIRTTQGSPELAERVPTADAGIVAAIRDAGGIVVGKTNIPEFSIGANTVNRLFGATGNPFGPTLTCGGSSGGSAVAVACGMAPLATGSDHGGSLRIPASFCGVVGHRSSPGVVPNEGRALAQTFYSTQGPMARTVGDAALLLSVIARRSDQDPMAFPLDPAALAEPPAVDTNRLRVAVSADLGGVLVSNAVRATFEDRVARMAPLFAASSPHPIDLRDGPDTDWKLRAEIFVAQYHRDIDRYGPDLNPNIRSSYAAAADADAGRRYRQAPADGALPSLRPRVRRLRPADLPDRLGVAVPLARAVSRHGRRPRDRDVHAMARPHLVAHRGRPSGDGAPLRPRPCRDAVRIADRRPALRRPPRARRGPGARARLRRRPGARPPPTGLRSAGAPPITALNSRHGR